MNERGLWLDLNRIVQRSMDRALELGQSWSLNHAFITDKTDRMHVVCGTLEALGYTIRRFEVGERVDQSAWELTDQGVELWNDLCGHYGARARLRMPRS